MKFFTFSLRFFAFVLLAISLKTQAQQIINHQIISANGGVFEFSAPYNDYVSVQTINPSTGEVSIFDTIYSQSVQDVCISGLQAYIAAQDSLIKYDLSTYQRLAAEEVSGINKVLLYGDVLIISRQYPVTSGFIQIRDAVTLDLIHQFEEVSGEAAGIVVSNDKAYVAVNGGWAGTSGKIAIIDLIGLRFDSEIDLGPQAIGIYNLYSHKGSIISVNRSPYGATSGSLSTLNPDNFNFINHVFTNATTGFGAGIMNSRLYCIFNGNIGSVSLETMSIENIELISNPAAADFGSITSACVDTINGKIFINAGDFFSFGQGYSYSTEGVALSTFESGISAEAMNIEYRNSTSIPAVDRQKVAIYPNPFSSSTVLKGIQSGESIHIFQLNGMEVYHQMAAETGLMEISLPSLSAGMYILQIHHGNMLISSQKLIKK
ncbi:MAG: T9SS type A sorting domain-containing protein [Bacteroidales bacterium]|nr:T9SS type A sorting domain-containing protein [Bacteroidales bacterium]